MTTDDMTRLANTAKSEEPLNPWDQRIAMADALLEAVERRIVELKRLHREYETNRKMARDKNAQRIAELESESACLRGKLETPEERLKMLRTASGGITIPGDERFASFLYELMRDHLPPGVIEGVLQHVLAEPGQGVVATNGWLALYARYVARALVGSAGDDRRK